MNNYPRISIVTPSYNQGKFIRETIESVLNQNYPNLEYFIVDGGSTDGSVDIIREYGSRIDWWVSEKDNGQSDAINKGFKKASGDLLCWVNSDDILLPGCLKSVAESYINNNKPELIHTNFIYIDQGSSVIKMIRIPRQTRFFIYRGIWSVSVPSSFFSTSLMHKVGYLNTDYHVSMDLDMWIRMIKAGARIHYIPKYMGAFRFHAASKTTFQIFSEKYSDSSDSEHNKIMDFAFPGTTTKSRWQWLMVWKFYRLINFNYLLSFIDTLAFRGKHWKQVFSRNYKDSAHYTIL
jgi:glycosyltransferase involved in cell wall biosynthesis